MLFLRKSQVTGCAKLVPMTRAARRLSAWLALAAFALSQLAISAFACPKDVEAFALGAPAASHGESCPQHRSANLCERHCEYGSTSVATAGPSPPPPDLALLPWKTAVVPTGIAAALTPERCLAPSAAPPPPNRPTPLRI
jgi:hypothetical protein